MLDSADPEALATFWAPALGYTRIGATDNYVLLLDATGRGPKLLLQRVAEPKSAKNRMHLDIDTPDVDGEVARLDPPRAEHGSRWVVMADPEGNEFCVCDAGNPSA